MEILVKLIAAESKNSITDLGTYVNKIYENMRDNGLIHTLCVNPMEVSSTVEAIKLEDEELGIYSLSFTSKDSGKTDTWKIQFCFGTYKEKQQMTVAIYSDTYEPSPAEDYLERVKLNINRCIKRDWEKIIWLFDKDSECLSIDLYPKVYQTENMLRQLINETMTRNYGIEWWDVFVPHDIKKKHVDRRDGYKAIAPGFNNVDERLMSIDVTDLLSIIRCKLTKWDPNYSDEINKMINGQNPCSANRIVEVLKKQMVVEQDLWATIFSKFLSDDFIEKYSEFEENRNHIAHNKLIDRAAYKQIKDSIDIVYEAEKKALGLIANEVISKEEKDAIERQREEERQAFEDAMMMNIQEEAGVVIRNNEEIMEYIADALTEFSEDVRQKLRFRQDVEVSEILFDASEICGEFLKVISKVTKEELIFTYDSLLISEQGMSTHVTISCDGEYIGEIEYVNGAVEYDEEQGYYLPMTQDGISEKEIVQLKNEIVDFVNETLMDLKEAAGTENYVEVTEGGNPVIQENLYCAECGEEWVYLGETLVAYGTCLHCGYVNEIEECDRCGTMFNVETEGYMNDEWNLCDCCKESYDEE
ncbi:MAG: hypothetical protein IJO65_12605 [Lachnospiraceae bacterium]|nr:hypothetical protein [Lachnospiraceae bacterium]